MVRISINSVNNTNAVSVCDFSNIDPLSKPLVGMTSVSLLRFSIPANMILHLWEDNPAKMLSIGWGGVTHSEPILLIDRGAQNRIYEADHLVEMFNVTLTNLVAWALANIPGFPTADVPYFRFERSDSTFQLITNLFFNAGAPNPIVLSCNLEARAFFQGFPFVRSTPTSKYDFITRLEPLNENLYVDASHFITRQEYTSVPNWFSPRMVIVEALDLPIESEIITTTTGASNETSGRILSSFIVPCEAGVSDLKSTLDYSSTTNHFRTCKLSGVPITSLRFAVRFLYSSGLYAPIYTLPGSISNIEIELL